MSVGQTNYSNDSVSSAVCQDNRLAIKCRVSGQQIGYQVPCVRTADWLSSAVCQDSRLAFKCRVSGQQTGYQVPCVRTADWLSSAVCQDSRLAISQCCKCM